MTFDIRCRDCGQTVAAVAARTRLVPKEVRLHRCPQPAPVICPWCAAEIGDQRVSCPNCGEPLLPE